MQCTATQTGHHWGTGVHRLPEHTPRVHSEVDASALNCGHNVLDVRVAQVEREF